MCVKNLFRLNYENSAEIGVDAKCAINMNEHVQSPWWPSFITYDSVKNRWYHTITMNWISFFQIKWRYVKDVVSLYFFCQTFYFITRFITMFSRPKPIYFHCIHSFDQVCLILLSVYHYKVNKCIENKSITIKSNQIKSKFRISKINPFDVYKNCVNNLHNLNFSRFFFFLLHYYSQNRQLSTSE